MATSITSQRDENMTPTYYKGEAVQVASLKGPQNDRKLHLHTKVLRSITNETKDYNVATIAIAGPARGGKSFILTYIIRYLQALEKAENGDVGDWMEKDNPNKSMHGLGFSFQNGTERTTDGIWMWSRPFIVKPSPNREPIAVIVIDTEGCFDYTTSEKDQCSIIGLSLLSSSCFIFNETTRINENTLMTLAKFMQYAQLASGSQSFEKHLQRLMFLVRDWTMPDTHPYGYIGGRQLIKNFMIEKPDTSQESVDCRNVLKRFGLLDAYLMPHPGDAVIADEFQGSVGEMSRIFQDHVEGFAQALVANVYAKEVSNRPIDGLSFYNLFESYVSAFNSDDMPRPTSVLNANVLIAFETILQQQVSAYQKEFQEKLSSSELPVQPMKDIQKWHKTISEKVVQAFNQRTKSLGSDKERVVFDHKLQIDLERSFHQFRKTNEEKQNELIKSSETVALANFSEFIENNVLSNEKLWTESEFNCSVSGVEENARSGFLKACEGLPEEFVNTQKILFNTKLQDLKCKYWTTLDNKRRSIEDKLSRILQEIDADYDDIMSEVTNEAIITEESLNTLHQRQLSNAVRKFNGKVKDICDTEFVQAFQEDLKARLNSKFDDINSKNQTKVQSFLANIESDIEQVASYLREELDVLILSPLSCTLEEFEQKYENCLEIALEHFEELHLSLLGQKMRQEYERKLERSLREVVVDAKQAVHLSKEIQERELKRDQDAKLNRCQEIFKVAIDDFVQQINLIKQNNQLVCEDQLLRAINLILDNTRPLLQSHLSLEDPDMVSKFVTEYDQFTEREQQKLLLDKLDGLKEFEKYALELSTKFRKEYEAYMDKYLECTSTEELSTQHDQILADIKNRYKTQLFDKSRSETLTTPWENRLVTELQNKFEQTIKSQFQAQLHKDMDELLDELVSNFEETIKCKIDENPFIGRKEYREALESAEDQCVSEFKQYSPFKKNNPDLLRNLSARINTITDDLDDYKIRAVRQAKKEITSLVETACTEAKALIQQEMKSSTLPDEDEMASIMKAIRAVFDDSWTFGPGDRKDEAWVEIERRVNPHLQSLKEVQIVKIDVAKKRAFTEGQDAFTSNANMVLENLSDGKIYTPQTLNEALEETMRTANEHFDEQYAEKNIKPTEQDRRDYYDRINEEALHVKKLNKANERAVMFEIQESCTQWFNLQNNSRASENDLLRLKDEAVQRCQKELQRKCVENLPLYPHLLKEITDICNLVLENISRQKKEAVNEDAIIQEAVQEYSSKMDKKLEKATSKDAKELAELHRQIVNKIIRDIKINNCISEDLVRRIEIRLEKSLMIYDNKYNLRNTTNNVAVGIDLGTTTTCIAIHRGDKVEVIKDDSGNALIPSYVCFQEDGGTKVGKAAKDESHLYPEHTIFDAKRLIGRQFSDVKVQEDIKTWPFKVVNRGGKPKIVPHHKEYDPEDISAHVLKYVKDLASGKLGVEVKKAVITVPANFDDRQRDATRQAAQISGLEVLQIINEPTAAAMAYTLHNSHGDKNILVFDFGGGTFDVTILKASAADLQVLTTMGDTHLGGEDFDHNMVLYCVDKFEAQHGIKLLQVDNANNIKDVQAVKRRIRRLRNHCENTKAILSLAESATVNVTAITKNGLDLSVTITKSEFENMNMHLFQKSIDIVSDAIKKAGLLPGEIDDVLMVGGSSRVPKIKDMLQKFLGKTSLNLNDEVDIQEAVAKGAATQACILSGGFSALKFIKDVNPFSLGIRLEEGDMSVIIKKDTPIPAEDVRPYTTVEDNQTEVIIEIFSGEDPIARKNKALGSFVLGGIPPERKGVQNIDVTMKIDESGILEVTAVCCSTGGRKNLIIKEGRGRLTNDEVEQKRQELGC